MKKPEPSGKKMVTRCPFCGDELCISRLYCGTCNTQIDSQLDIPPFFGLPTQLQDFVIIFLQCRGNIREVEKALGISYPTVCKRLDLINELLRTGQKPSSRRQILEQLERGRITVKEATQLLKENRT